MQGTHLHIPYAGIGIYLFLILLSMIAAYCVDPKGIKKTEKSDEGADDSTGRGLEITLMILLFFYVGICVNVESSFSSECAVDRSKSSDTSMEMITFEGANDSI